MTSLLSLTVGLLQGAKELSPINAPTLHNVSSYANSDCNGSLEAKRFCFDRLCNFQNALQVMIYLLISTGFPSAIFNSHKYVTYSHEYTFTRITSACCLASYF